MNNSHATYRTGQESPQESPPKKKRGLWWVMKRVLVVFGLMLLLLVVLNFRLLPGPNSRLVRPSPETTWITEPLKPNGDVDYLAWVNEQGRIPPEENAFAGLVKILGPDAHDIKLNDEVFAQLGISPPPKDGDYLERFVYARDGRPGMELDTTINGMEVKGIYSLMLMQDFPFTAEHFPEAIKWFERNDHHLEAIASAVRKSRFWAPKYGEYLGDSAVGGLMGLREISRIFQRSSMRHLGNHDAKRAIADQLVIIRIGHHVWQHASMSELLLSSALDGTGYAALAETVYRNECSQADLEWLAGELDLLAAPRQMGIDHVNQNRAECLEYLLRMGRSGPLILDKDLTGYYQNRHWDPLVRSAVGWSVALQTSNEWYERVQRAFEAETEDETAKLLDAITLELANADHQGGFGANLRVSLLGGAEGRGRFVGNRFSALLIDGLHNLFNARIRNRAEHEVTRTAVAVERYRLKYGEPPANLADVAPEFLPEIPVDPFSGAPLVYKSDPNQGYLLYSIGPNRRDDGGQYLFTDGGGDIVARQPPYTLDSWVKEINPK